MTHTRQTHASGAAHESIQTKQSVTGVTGFQAWYEKKFRRRMPIYLRTDVKRKLMAEYETNFYQ